MMFAIAWSKKRDDITVLFRIFIAQGTPEAIHDAWISAMLNLSDQQFDDIQGTKDGDAVQPCLIKAWFEITIIPSEHKKAAYWWHTQNMRPYSQEPIMLSSSEVEKAGYLDGNCQYRLEDISPTSVDVTLPDIHQSVVTWLQEEQKKYVNAQKDTSKWWHLW